MMVYIGASQPLDLIAWSDAQPAFYVSELHESELPVREQLSTPYVYHAGSHEGCGCGFQYGEYPQFEDDQRHLKRASLDAFSAYLARQLERVDLIELYACWDGDQSATPKHRRSLTPRSLQSEEFFFLQRELSRMEKDAA
jgi:hypothetical protein